MIMTLILLICLVILGIIVKNQLGYMLDHKDVPKQIQNLSDIFSGVERIDSACFILN